MPPDRSIAARVIAAVTLRTLIEFAVAVAATLVFVDIAEDVIEGNADAFDAPLARAIRDSLDSNAADALFGTVTHAGSGPAIFATTAAIALFALRRRHRRTAAIVVANSLVAEGLDQLLKTLFARARPNLSPLIDLPASFSFPSGHAMVSLATYAAAAAVIARLAPHRRVPAIVVASVLVMAIGVSRVYLGVHWPLDVLAGYAAAAPLVAVTLHLMRRLDPIDHRSRG